MRAFHGLFLAFYLALIGVGYGLYGSGELHARLRTQSTLANYVFAPLESWIQGRKHSDRGEIARITEIHGRGLVRYRPSNALIFKRAASQQIFDGKTVIFTGNASSARIHIKELGVDFEVSADTIVVLDQHARSANEPGGFELSLLAGQLNLTPSFSAKLPPPTGSAPKETRLVIKDFVRMKERVMKVSTGTTQVESEITLSTQLPGKIISSDTKAERDPASQSATVLPLEVPAFLREPAGGEFLSFMSVGAPAEPAALAPEEALVPPAPAPIAKTITKRKQTPNLDALFRQETSFIRQYNNSEEGSSAFLTALLESKSGTENRFSPALAFGASEFMQRYLSAAPARECGKARELLANVDRAFPQSEERSRWLQQWSVRLAQTNCVSGARRPASVRLDQVFRNETAYLRSASGDQSAAADIALSLALLKAAESEQNTFSAALGFGTGQVMNRYLSSATKTDCRKAQELFSNVAEAFRTGDTLESWKADWSNKLKSAGCAP